MGEKNYEFFIKILEDIFSFPDSGTGPEGAAEKPEKSEQNVFSPRAKWGIMTVILQKRGVLRMKGFSVCGLVLGITAAVCGVCAVVFSVLGLRRRR